MKVYGDGRAFRVALEDRLRRLARESAHPSDRLRKEAVAQRLLAGLVAVAPPGTWALKGGLALIARLGPGARATRDADTTWRGGSTDLRDVLDEVVDHDAGDWFRFEIGRGGDSADRRSLCTLGYSGTMVVGGGRRDGATQDR